MGHGSKSSLSFFHHFEALEDPRIDRCKRHQLRDILFLAVCAMISGANDFVAMEKYGHAKRALLEKFQELAKGIPSHEAVGRIFAMVDRSEERTIGNECMYKMLA